MKIITAYLKKANVKVTIKRMKYSKKKIDMLFLRFSLSFLSFHSKAHLDTDTYMDIKKFLRKTIEHYTYIYIWDINKAISVLWQTNLCQKAFNVINWKCLCLQASDSFYVHSLKRTRITQHPISSAGESQLTASCIVQIFCPGNSSLPLR